VSPPNTTYSTLLLIAGVICFFVVIIIVQTRRAATGARALIALLLALAWWDITYAIFWAGAFGVTKHFWLDLTYVGAVTVPAALFIFSLQCTNRQGWLKPPLATFIYIEPIVVLTALFTDPYYGLFFAGKRAENSAVILDGGPVFWFNVAYSYALILLATIFIARGYLRSSGIYRKQLGILLLGILFTWLNSIVVMLRLNPLPGADNTPFSFTITAIAFAFAIVRYRLLDLIPVARDSLVEKMEDGVLVIDTYNRIVDMNPAAQRLLNISSNMFGKPVEEAMGKWNHYEKILSSSKGNEIELDGKRLVDMQVTSIGDGKGRDVGRLIVLRDITSRKQSEAEEQRQRILAQALQETSQALNSTLDYESVLEKILVSVGSVVPIDSANIALLDDHGILHYVRFYGYMEHKVSQDELQGFSLDASPIFKRVFETGEPLIIPDTHADPDWITIPSGAWIRSFAVMPIRIKTQVVGFLNLDSAVKGFYTPEHIHSLRAFADQVAIAVENARLYATAEREIMERKQAEEKLRQQNEYYSILHQITVELLGHPHAESLLNIIAERAAALVNAQHGFMFLSEGDLLVLRAATKGFSHNIGRSEPKPGTGVLGEVWTSGKTIAVENYTTWELRDPDYNSEKLVAIAGVPIQAGGIMTGVLEVANTDRARPFSEAEIEILNQFSLLASLVLDNTRLFSGLQTELAERKQVEKKLQKLSRAVEQSPSSIVITDTSGCIEYVNPRFTEVTGYSAEEVIGKNPRVLKTDKTSRETHRQLWQEITAGREWHGEFVNRKKNGEEYYEHASISPIMDDQGIATHYLAVKEDITGQKMAEKELRNKNQVLQFQLEAIEKLQAELREQAIRDPLTGLYNRRYLAETQERELAHALRDGYEVGFVMVDIDHFKNINDTFGHEVGDQVLQRLATLIKEQTRLGDIVCRYGGEEILVILLNVTQESAFQTTDRWRAAFMYSALPMEFGRARCTVSCGIALYPQHGGTANELITLADKAMYQAKALGRNRVVVWNPESEKKVPQSAEK
jgi:diguanylate cyclase (GGDEF)-like protein/PAS domain S-box-containing protein